MAKKKQATAHRKAKSANTRSGSDRLSTSDRWAILITNEMFGSGSGPIFKALGGSGGYMLELQTSDEFNLVPITQSVDLGGGGQKYFTMFHEVKGATVRRPTRPEK